MKFKNVMKTVLAMTALAAVGCGERELPIVSKGPKVTSLYRKGNLANPLNVKASASNPGRAFARLGRRAFGR